MGLGESPICFSQDDKLRLNELAEAVVRLTDTGTTEHVGHTLGIYGSWGCGKTSLLNLVRERCNQNTTWIAFDAWAQQTPTGILVPLVREVARAKPRLPTAINSFRRLAKVIALSSMDIALRSATGGMKVDDVTKHLITVDADSPGIPDDPVNLLRREFKQLVQSIKTHKKPRVLVAIDNLDRCRPETALTTLEALSTFLYEQGCSYLIAVDDTVLASFITRCYSGTHLDGWRFLEKVIPDYIRIPTPRANQHFAADDDPSDEVLTFLRSLSAEANWLTVHEAEMWELMSGVTILRNPRRLKRIVRQLALVKDELENAKVFRCAMALVTMSDVWPDLFQQFISSSATQWKVIVAELLPAKTPSANMRAQGPRIHELQEFVRIFKSVISSHKELWMVLDRLRGLGL